MLKLVRKFQRNESGVTAIEYGLIAGLVAIVIIFSLQTLGSSLKGKFDAVAEALNGAGGTGTGTDTSTQ